MNRPLVSILILTYNHEKFVLDSINSVLNQEYSNIEIVVGDDASTDATSEIVRQLAIISPDIIFPLIQKRNLGVTNNLNFMLSKCRGEFVCFHDGDDIMLPGKIKKLVAYMQQNSDCGLCYHDMDVFDSNSGKHLYFWSQRFGKNKGDASTVIRLGTYMGGSSVMLRRADIPENGVDHRIQRAPDWFLWVSALAVRNSKVGYIDDVLSRYRRHSQSVTATSDWKNDERSLTLNIFQERYPYYESVIKKRRAELNFLQAIRLAKNGILGPAMRLFFLSSFSTFPYLVPWFRLVVREFLFLWRIGFYRLDSYDDF